MNILPHFCPKEGEQERQVVDFKGKKSGGEPGIRTLKSVVHQGVRWCHSRLCIFELGLKELKSAPFLPQICPKKTSYFLRLFRALSSTSIKISVAVLILALQSLISACSDQVDVIHEYKCNPSLPNQSENISQNEECKE